MGQCFFVRSAAACTASVSWWCLLFFITTPSANTRLRVSFTGQVGKGAEARSNNRCTLYNSNLMDTGLKNRVAIVAASSQGIGRATAEALAAEGCRVAMCARNAQTLHAAAEGIEKQYSAAVFAQA